MQMIYRKTGNEYWLKWDETAHVHEMFASEDGSEYLGCFSTIREAEAYAREMEDKRMVDSIVAYAFEPHLFRKLEEVTGALFGNGMPMSNDQRRDLANLMAVIIGEAVPLKAKDLA